ALLNLDLHFEFASIGQIGNHVIRIDDFYVVRQFDVAGQHNTSAFLAQHQSNFFTVMQLENHAFQVQQNVDDIFTNASNRGVLVNHTSHLHFGGSIACHG